MSTVVNPHSSLRAERNTGSLKRLRENRDAHKTYFLGIDGGGTKTQAIITDANFKIIGEGKSGASNPHRVGFKEAVANILLATDKALKDAGLELTDITAACAGIAGVSHPIHYHTMKDALDRSLDLERFELVTDARVALTGALDGNPGVIVIAGTGSIALGVNEDGKDARSGGWGPTFSDEGSGYDIARQALKAVAASFDGRSSATLLTKMVCKELGIEKPSDLPGVIYSEDAKPAQIASLAKLVSEAAQQGDEVAQEILEQAGRELGQLAVAVIERLAMQQLSFQVACVGSVFNSGDFVLASFRRTILSVAPNAKIGEPIYPPTIGAAKLAEILLNRG
jgi:N-acetylglucosamine kinase-like BadF-type ATPase